METLIDVEALARQIVNRMAEKRPPRELLISVTPAGLVELLAGSIRLAFLMERQTRTRADRAIDGRPFVTGPDPRD